MTDEPSSLATSETSDLDRVKALLAQGASDVLVRFAGGTWSYPGVSFEGDDRDVPTAFIDDATIQSMLARLDLVPVVHSHDGVRSVRLRPAQPVMTLTLAQAGSVEASTEAPPAAPSGSEIEAAVLRAMASLGGSATPAITQPRKSRGA